MPVLYLIDSPCLYPPPANVRLAERHGEDFGRKITPHWVGYLVRRKLGLKTEKRHGTYVLAAGEEPKLSQLFERYGIVGAPNSGDFGDSGMGMENGSVGDSTATRTLRLPLNLLQAILSAAEQSGRELLLFCSIGKGKDCSQIHGSLQESVRIRAMALVPLTQEIPARRSR